MLRGFSAFFVCASLVVSTGAFSKVYRNISVGDYSRASYSLQDCEGKTFLQFMKDTIYPAIVEESRNMSGGQHIDGVKKGEGVELRLTSDVSTYHVKFKAHGEDKAERSGRSFSAVGNNPRRPSYVADASYSHYLGSLQKVIENESEEELDEFYHAILGVLSSCDASAFSKLNTETKRVAADFVAVYVAEQYRHLLGGRGKKLGRAHNWDDALLQVTLLSSFHAGQTEEENGMYYEGSFTSSVYNQIYDENGEKFCVYNQPKHPKRSTAKKRGIQLRDYWQFNKKCDRSGVNVTRRDFQKMGSAITKWSKENGNGLSLFRGGNSNAYTAIAGFFVNDTSPGKLNNADALVGAVTGFLREVRTNAVDITRSLE